MRKPAWTWPKARDPILFVGGLAGVAHETLLRPGLPRPDLLFVFMAMMGLPYVFGRGNGGNGGK